MFKKIFFLCVLLVSIVASAQDLKEIRSQYSEAVKSSEITNSLEGELMNVNFVNNSTLLAYKGAVLTLKAKFSKSKEEKKRYYKEGVSSIENAIKVDSSNIEIRYLRLSVQENSPKFLGYHKNVEEDKEIILKNYSNISSKELKEILKDYVLKSESFDENEKSELKKS